MRHDHRSDEIADEMADHLRCRAALLEFDAVLLDSSRPDFSEQSHVPDGANDPVSCCRASYWYPVHNAGCLNGESPKQEKIWRN